MDARYVFAVRFRLDPDPSVSVQPAEFDTRLFRAADPPGEPGWLFFRDNLWRGDLADASHFRDLATDALGVPVVDVEYTAFETDGEYYDALQEAIAADLDLFKADSVAEVVNKYLGSTMEVTRGDENDEEAEGNGGDAKENDEQS